MIFVNLSRRLLGAVLAWTSWTKTEVMEEISSQNSDLGLEDLDKLEAKGQAENTKTKYIVYRRF